MPGPNGPTDVVKPEGVVPSVQPPPGSEDVKEVLKQKIALVAVEQQAAAGVRPEKPTLSCEVTYLAGEDSLVEREKEEESSEGSDAHEQEEDRSSRASSSGATAPSEEAQLSMFWRGFYATGRVFRGAAGATGRGIKYAAGATAGAAGSAAGTVGTTAWNYGGRATTAYMAGKALDVALKKAVGNSIGQAKDHHYATIQRLSGSPHLALLIKGATAKVQEQILAKIPADQLFATQIAEKLMPTVEELVKTVIYNLALSVDEEELEASHGQHLVAKIVGNIFAPFYTHIFSKESPYQKHLEKGTLTDAVKNEQHALVSNELKKLFLRDDEARITNILWAVNGAVQKVTNALGKEFTLDLNLDSLLQLIVPVLADTTNSDALKEELFALKGGAQAVRAAEVVAEELPVILAKNKDDIGKAVASGVRGFEAGSALEGWVRLRYNDLFPSLDERFEELRVAYIAAAPAERDALLERMISSITERHESADAESFADLSKEEKIAALLAVQKAGATPYEAKFIRAYLPLLDETFDVARQSYLDGTEEEKEVILQQMLAAITTKYASTYEGTFADLTDGEQADLLYEIQANYADSYEQELIDLLIPRVVLKEDCTDQQLETFNEDLDTLFATSKAAYKDKFLSGIYDQLSQQKWEDIDANLQHMWEMVGHHIHNIVLQVGISLGRAVSEDVAAGQDAIAAGASLLLKEASDFLTEEKREELSLAMHAVKAKEREVAHLKTLSASEDLKSAEAQLKELKKAHEAQFAPLMDRYLLLIEEHLVDGSPLVKMVYPLVRPLLQNLTGELFSYFFYDLTPKSPSHTDFGATQADIEAIKGFSDALATNLTRPSGEALSAPIPDVVESESGIIAEATVDALNELMERAVLTEKDQALFQKLVAELASLRTDSATKTWGLAEQIVGALLHKVFVHLSDTYPVVRDYTAQGDKKQALSLAALHLINLISEEVESFDAALMQDIGQYYTTPEQATKDALLVKIAENHGESLGEEFVLLIQKYTALPEDASRLEKSELRGKIHEIFRAPLQPFALKLMTKAGVIGEEGLNIPFFIDTPVRKVLRTTVIPEMVYKMYGNMTLAETRLRAMEEETDAEGVIAGTSKYLADTLTPYFKGLFEEKGGALAKHLNEVLEIPMAEAEEKVLREELLKIAGDSSEAMQKMWKGVHTYLDKSIQYAFTHLATRTDSAESNPHPIVQVLETLLSRATTHLGDLSLSELTDEIRAADALEDPEAKEQAYAALYQKFQPLVIELLKEMGMEAANDLPIIFFFQSVLWKSLTEKLLPELLVNAARDLLIKTEPEAISTKTEVVRDLSKTVAHETLAVVKGSEPLHSNIAIKMAEQLPEGLLGEGGIEELIHYLTKSSSPAVQNGWKFFETILGRVIHTLVENGSSTSTEDTEINEYQNPLTRALLNVVKTAQTYFTDNSALIDAQLATLEALDDPEEKEAQIRAVFGGLSEAILQTAGLETADKLFVPLFGEMAHNAIKKTLLPSILMNWYVNATAPGKQDSEYHMRLMHLFFNPKMLSAHDAKTVLVERVKEKSDETVSPDALDAHVGELVTQLESSSKLLGKTLREVVQGLVAKHGGKAAFLETYLSDKPDALEMVQEAIVDITDADNSVMEPVWGFVENHIATLAISLLTNLAEKAGHAHQPKAGEHPQKYLAANIITTLLASLKEHTETIESGFAALEAIENPEEKQKQQRLLFKPLVDELLGMSGVDAKQIPLMDEMRGPLWDLLQNEFLPDFFFGIYRDLTSWTRQKEALEAKLDDHFKNPVYAKAACDVLSHFVSQFVPQHFSDTSEDMSTQVMELIDKFTAAHGKTADGKGLQDFIANNRGALAALIGGNIQGLTDTSVDPIKGAQSATKEYLHATLLGVFGGFMERVDSIEKDEESEHYNKRFLIDLVTGLIEVATDHFTTVSEVTRRAGKKHAHQVSDEEMRAGFGDKLHPAVADDFAYKKAAEKRIAVHRKRIAVLEKEIEDFRKQKKMDPTKRLGHIRAREAEIKKLEKKISKIERKVADQAKKRRMNQFLIPLSRKLLQRVGIHKAKDLIGKGIPENLVNELYELLKEHALPEIMGLVMDMIMDPHNFNQIALSGLQALNDFAQGVDVDPDTDPVGPEVPMVETWEKLVSTFTHIQNNGESRQLMKDVRVLAVELVQSKIPEKKKKKLESFGESAIAFVSLGDRYGDEDLQELSEKALDLAGVKKSTTRKRLEEHYSELLKKIRGAGHSEEGGLIGVDGYYEEFRENIGDLHGKPYAESLIQIAQAFVRLVEEPPKEGQFRSLLGDLCFEQVLRKQERKISTFLNRQSIGEGKKKKIRDMARALGRFALEISLEKDRSKRLDLMNNFKAAMKDVTDVRLSHLVDEIEVSLNQFQEQIIDSVEQHALNTTCGELVRQIAKSLPNDIAAAFMEVKKVRAMAAEAVGLSIRQSLAKWSISGLIEKVLEVGLPSLHPIQWTPSDDRSTHAGYGPGVVVGTTKGGVDIVHPKERFEFAFPQGTEARQAEAEAKLKEAKVTHEKVRKEAAKTYAKRARMMIGDTIKSKWAVFQKHFDRIIEKTFGKFGVRIKSFFDKLCRIFFFEVLGTALEVIFFPLTWVFWKCVELHVRRKVKGLQKDINIHDVPVHENMYYKIFEVVMERLRIPTDEDVDKYKGPHTPHLHGYSDYFSNIGDVGTAAVKGSRTAASGSSCRVL